ncbi:MAG: ABC transporter permease subunit [Lachnospiraceae bacterium]|nr:ABC transporter permease subunit [Lachnospiraceae bacterium]
MTKRKYVYLLALVPFIVIALMYELVPIVRIILNSFVSDDSGLITMANYQTVFTKLLYRKAIFNSIKISLLSAAAGIIIAFLGARAAHNSGGKVRSVFMTILNMVSNFAGVPLASAYMILLGNSGVMIQMARQFGWDALANFNLYSTNGISLVYVYFQIPLSTLLMIPAFEGIRKEWQEASTLLGANNTTFWGRVGIPVLMPSIMGTFSVLFANALAAYATVYALMMDSIALLPVQIAGCFVGEVKIRNGLGGALSVVMMLVMVIMIFVTNAISHRFEKGVRK